MAVINRRSNNKYYMKLEKIKWIDDCEECGVVVNAKRLYIEQYDSDAEECFKEQEYLPWTCPSCKHFNNLRN